MGWTANGIRRQVNRFKALPRGEEDRPWDTLKFELERVLQQVAESDDHARSITDRVIDTAKFCPSMVDIREAAGALSKTLDEIRPDPDCAKCGGAGSIVVERGGLSGATSCDCWARRALPSWALPGARETARSGKGLVSVAEVGGRK